MRLRSAAPMYRALKEHGVTVLEEPPRRQPCGDTEVVIRDPNGYVRPLSEGP